MFEKGKLGISIKAIAVVAFIVALLSGSLTTLLIVGVALIVEKNEWLSKQVLKAFYLTLSYSLVTYILREVFSMGSSLFYKIPFIGHIAGGIVGGVQTVLFTLLSIVYIIVMLYAAMKVSKGENVSIPIIDKFIDATFGKEDKE